MDPIATREAEKIVQEYNAKSLPISPLEIAEEHEIACQAMPSSSGGVSGMFIRNGNAYGILYSTHIDNEGFQNFSVGHELGHYFLPGHPEAVFSSGVMHGSRAGFVSKNKYEKEADQFACGLLMPQFLFDPALKKAGEGLDAIKSLGKLCGTSLTATAIRYSERTAKPSAIVVSIGNKVDYCFMSDELKEYSGLSWIKKDSHLPRNCSTLKFNQNIDNVHYSKEDYGTTDLTTWFGGNYEGTIHEEIIGLGSYGKTLTILSAEDLPNPGELEEEKELEESWDVHF